MVTVKVRTTETDKLILVMDEIAKDFLPSACGMTGTISEAIFSLILAGAGVEASLALTVLTLALGPELAAGAGTTLLT